MTNDIAQQPWHELRSKGFVHVRQFLSETELQMLRQDYATQARGGSNNGNYSVAYATPMAIWRLERKMQAVATQVLAATGLNADLSVCGLYFAIEKGINFSWHQDHDSYYLFQQHLEHFNFYLPIVKSDPKHSNVSLVPFDRLEARVPGHIGKVVGRGAQEYTCEENRTLIANDDDGSEDSLPVNIEELKVTPELEVGDLLLLRGDIVHRTQDTLAERVAVSFRRTRANARISRSRLLDCCARKREMMRKNWQLYQDIFDCLNELKLEEITARQFHEFRSRELQAQGCGQATTGDGVIAV